MIEAFPTQKPIGFAVDVADALVLTERSSDAMIVSTAQLIETAIGARDAARINGPSAQPILDELENAISSQFASRRAIIAVHAKLRLIGERLTRASSADPWGPSEPCKFATQGEAATPRVTAAA